MGYHYLDDFATADIAFEAEGESVEQVFVAAAEATMNVMIEELRSIEPLVEKRSSSKTTSSICSSSISFRS